MKKLLVLSPYFPYPLDEGGHIRTFNIIQALSKEFEIYLFSFLVEQRAVEISELMKYCKDYSAINVPTHKKDILHKLMRNGRRILLLKNPSADTFFFKEAKRGLSDYINTIKPDIAIIEHSWLAGYAAMLKAAGIKVILDAHNVESNLWKQFYQNSAMKEKIPYYFFWKSMILNEKRFMRHFCLIISTSGLDVEKIKYIAPQVPKEVIPNGIDLDRYRANEPEEQNSIGFIGLMRYPPNVQAVLYFLKIIFPLVKQAIPDVKFFIAGKDPSEEILKLSDNKNVFVTGYVPDAIKFMSKCSIMITPLLQGSGTRTKILEAMSLKKPVVSTSKGAEGLMVENGRDISIEDNPEAFAKAVISLLKNRDLRKSRGEEAYKTVVSNYSWASIGNKLISAIKEVA